MDDAWLPAVAATLFLTTRSCSLPRTGRWSIAEPADQVGVSAATVRLAMVRHGIDRAATESKPTSSRRRCPEHPESTVTEERPIGDRQLRLLPHGRE